MRSIVGTGSMPSVVTIFQGRGMSWWQLATLIIYVGFQSRDVLDLEMLFLEFEWATICQDRGMSWWQLDTLIICVWFWWRDISDLKMLFLEVDRVICKNVIFSNAIETCCHNNLTGLGHELVEIVQVDKLCWVLKTWWVRLGRIGFGYWLGDLPNSTIFNIIFQGGNSILMEYMVNISMSFSHIEANVS